MLTKIVIIFILLAVIFALGISLYYMVKDGDKGLRTTKALTWRIILTITLLCFILLAYHFGWIHPNHLIQF
jgi:hypothetical protein